MKLPKVNKKVVFIIFGVIFFIVTVFFFFYKFGFLRYYELKSQTRALKEEIQGIDQHNDNLKAEIDSLKTRDSKIEKVAREKYNMIRRGEKAFKVIEK